MKLPNTICNNICHNLNILIDILTCSYFIDKAIYLIDKYKNFNV